MKLQALGGLAALLLSASTWAAAQNTAKPVITSVAHVAIRTASMDGELAFFNQLGFEKAFTIERNGKTAFYFVKINDHEYIEVHPTVSPDGKTHPAGFDHICFESNDAKALYAQWAAAGLKPTPIAPGPDATLEFGALDPEGRMAEALEVVAESKQTGDKGLHMTANAVSKTLMGVTLPATDVAASQKFFVASGLVATAEGAKVKLLAAGHPELLTVLTPAGKGVESQLLFAVANLAQTAKKLTALGVKFEQGKGQLIIRDPDGTAFVLVATAAHK